jgi:hypothetical protein
MTRRTGQCTDYLTAELTEAVTKWQRWLRLWVLLCHLRRSALLGR